jgi:DNA-binding GntR family transcriptional regulator
MPVSAPSNAPPTTAEYVLDSIRDGILNGQYALGSRFDQKAIARDLGVSLVPVREALRILEGEGFVKITPRRGAFVTDISATELEELYLIRAELEELATRRAVPNLRQEEIAHLAAVIAEMEEATQTSDFARLLVLNRDFHFTIYEAAGLSMLSELMNSLWNRSSLYRRVFTYLPERAVQALEEHKAIYRACESGDGESAGKAIRRNIHQTVNALLEEFENEENLTIKPLIGNGQHRPGLAI